jgi:hypothetical protein
MGEESRQIASDIDRQRRQLADNVGELEGRVKDSVNWRVQMQQRPMTMVGIAFGGGILLSTLMGGRHRSTSRRSYDGGSYRARPEDQASLSGQPESYATEYQKRRAANVWDNMKGALIGVAAVKFKNFLEQAIPGFTEQYNKTEQAKESAKVGAEA